VFPDKRVRDKGVFFGAGSKGEEKVPRVPHQSMKSKKPGRVKGKSKFQLPSHNLSYEEEGNPLGLLPENSPRRKSSGCPAGQPINKRQCYPKPAPPSLGEKRKKGNGGSPGRAAPIPQLFPPRSGHWWEGGRVPAVFYISLFRVSAIPEGRGGTRVGQADFFFFFNLKKR